MTDFPTPPIAPSELDPEFSKYIGRIAAAWSSVELSINLAIWAVAGLEPALGACITMQIYTLDGRLKALLALLKLRGAPKSLIEAVNEYADDSRGPQELRNRIIHDNWMWREDGSVARLEIVAPKKLKFDFVDTDIETLKKNYKTIKDFATRSSKLRKMTYDALPSLPEIPRATLRPIIDHLRDQ